MNWDSLSDVIPIMPMAQWFDAYQLLMSGSMLVGQLIGSCQNKRKNAMYEQIKLKLISIKIMGE